MRRRRRRSTARGAWCSSFKESHIRCEVIAAADSAGRLCSWQVYWEPECWRCQRRPHSLPLGSQPRNRGAQVIATRTAGAATAGTPGTAGTAGTPGTAGAAVGTAGSCRCRRQLRAIPRCASVPPCTSVPLSTSVCTCMYASCWRPTCKYPRLRRGLHPGYCPSPADRFAAQSPRPARVRPDRPARGWSSLQPIFPHVIRLLLGDELARAEGAVMGTQLQPHHTGLLANAAPRPGPCYYPRSKLTG